MMSKKLYDGFLKVEEIERDDGVKRELLRKDPCVVMLVLNHDYTKMYLTEEWRAGNQKESLGVPAGVIDEGETPEEAMYRELREEIGFKKEQIKDTLEIGDYYSSLGFTDEHCYFFLVVIDEGEEPYEQDLDDDEKINIKVTNCPMYAETYNNIDSLKLIFLLEVTRDYINSKKEESKSKYHRTGDYFVSKDEPSLSFKFLNVGVHDVQYMNMDEVVEEILEKGEFSDTIQFGSSWEGEIYIKYKPVALWGCYHCGVKVDEIDIPINDMETDVNYQVPITMFFVSGERLSQPTLTEETRKLFFESYVKETLRERIVENFEYNGEGFNREKVLTKTRNKIMKEVR